MNEWSQRRIFREIASGLFALALSTPVLCFPAYEDPGSWIGIGARVRPAYQGADSSRADVIPYLRWYGQHLFARTTQGMLEGGVRTSAFGPWVFGAQLAYEEGRVTDESAFLKAHNFEDIDSSASVGLHVEADWMLGQMPWNALARFRQNLDSDLGAQADIRATAGIFSRGGFDFAAFAQLTWADVEAMQSYFGITPQQSVVTGLPAYNAGAGPSTANYGLLGSIDVGRPWIVLWDVHAQQLQGDARDAPIVQDRTNWYANVGIAYRF
jgi:MipA family protein